jgi:hypothetical protein
VLNIAEITMRNFVEFLQAINSRRRGLYTRARDWLEIESGPRQTYYVGSPRSGWQVRAYQKLPDVARVEFILRPPALRTLNIKHPSDLLQFEFEHVKQQHPRLAGLLERLGEYISAQGDTDRYGRPDCNGDGDSAGRKAPADGSRTLCASCTAVVNRSRICLRACSLNGGVAAF